MKKTLLAMSLAVAGSVSAQWTAQNTNFTAASRGVENIQIIDANTVWAQGYDGTAANANVQEFTRTTDGGNTWIPGTIEIFDPALTITNLSAVSATTAFAGATDAELGFGGVYKTTDGGLNWTNSNPSGYITNGSYFNVVHFFDANTGVTQGDPINGEFEMYRTTNAGTTWTAIPAASLPDPATGEYGYNGGNVGVGNSFWFVTNRGNLYRTNDAGVTWTKLTTPISDFSATAVGGQIFFSDANNGILIARATVGTTNTFTLYKTSNGGTTWGPGTAYTQPYRNLSYIRGTTVLVGTGVQGTTYSTAYSNDNGTTWTQIDSGTQRTSIAFLNGTTGWSGGFTDQASMLGGIFKYTGASLSAESFDNVSKIVAYPNPVASQLNFNTTEAANVVVRDILGKQVLSASIDGVSANSIDMSGLNTGIYLVSISNENGAQKTFKVSKL